MNPDKKQWSKPLLRHFDSSAIREMSEQDPSGERLLRVQSLVQEALEVAEKSEGGQEALSKMRRLLGTIEDLLAGNEQIEGGSEG